MQAERKWTLAALEIGDVQLACVNVTCLHVYRRQVHERARMTQT